MSEKKLLRDCNSKKIYATEHENLLELEFKDAATEFDGEKKAGFKDKGIFKNTISEAIFEYLAGFNIPTHYSGKLSEVRSQVKNLDMIPISVMVRNTAAGGICQRFRLEEGVDFQYPVIEYYLNDEQLDCPMILESHAYALGYASPDEMKHISRLTSKINAVLKAFFERRALKLINYKLEFGRYQNHIHVADEITPDTCRIWHVGEDNEVDKDYFHFENSNARRSYEEMLERIMGNKS